MASVNPTPYPTPIVSYRSNEGKDHPTVRIEDGSLPPKIPVREPNTSIPPKDQPRMNRWVAAWCRETRVFCDMTCMHGMKRVWEANGLPRLFWLVVVFGLGGYLCYEVANIIKDYTSHPVVSEYDYLLVDGMPMPRVTMCSLNQMKKSYVDKINQTGLFTKNLARYLIVSTKDVLNIFGGNIEADLVKENDDFLRFQAANPNFTINNFFAEAGFECSEILKLCSFAGRPFDCCQYATTIMTDLGLCQVLNLQASPTVWMRKQTTSSEEGGLQIVLDAHLEELIDDSLNSEPVFTTRFENGFKLYVEEVDASTYNPSTGIVVSPGDIIYTGVSLTTHSLLDVDNWGECIKSMPTGYKPLPGVRYQSPDCNSQCISKFFVDRCGCAPMDYNLEKQGYRSCTPLEAYRCVQKYVVVNLNQTDEDYKWPACSECATECEVYVYTTSNSYGRGFSNDTVASLHRYNKTWTPEHIRDNFLSIAVFFRDMSYTSYTEVQDASITTVLSGMGGTMGLFLGMSVLTVLECLIYLAKIVWFTLFCGRMRYNAKKEEEHRKAQQR